MLTFLPQQEQAHCDPCDSVIPTDNIVAKVDDRTGIQSIMAKCPHCRRLYGLQRQLYAGTWQIVGGVKELTIARVKARFEKAMAEKRGDVQLATA